MKRKQHGTTAAHREKMEEKRARRTQARRGPPPRWSEAMRRQPRRVQIATYRSHERYGAAKHATKALRIRAGKR